MINPLEYTNDKSLYPAQATGMLGGLIGMIIWLFPDWTGISGFFKTLGMTGATTMTVLVITGLYKKHEQRILKFFDTKPKFLRNGKAKKDNSKAA